jgi:hypothetical protein
MIKVGDIIVCINNVYHYYTKNIRFIKGNHYIVKKVVSNEIMLTPEDGDDDCYVTYRCYENFMSLGQWREKQINDILN